MASPSSPAQHTGSEVSSYRAPPPWRLVLLVVALICGVIAVRNVYSEAHQVIGWAVAASVVAMLLTPFVQQLDRHIPRALAIAVTFVSVVALSAGMTWLYSSNVLDQVDQIQESGPRIAEEIEGRSDRIGELAREVGLVDQVGQLTDRLGERTGSRGDTIRSVAMSAPPYFVSMILTIFLLLFGPTMVNGALGLLSAGRRRRFGPALGEATRRTQLYVWASIVQGVVTAFTIWVVGSLLDVPAITLLAILGGVIALVPYLGILVGWIPVLLLGVGVAPVVQVAIAAIVAVALQLVEALWWRRVVDERSLHVGPALLVIVAIVGFGVDGVGGAFYGCVLAVLAVAFTDQLAPAGVDLPTPLDDPDEMAMPVAGGHE